ncbi:MAG: hypothetical protein MJ240_12125 [Kiritimatiellae bacterium]|nr:hypothetical protein [Kiritimatiellia bacterium]
MMRISLVLGTVLACLLVSAAENLVVNPDLAEDDGIGTVLGWKKHIRNELNTTIDAQAIGDGAFHLHAKGVSYAFYMQSGIGLVPQSPYRLSYEVRTAGLNGAKPAFYLFDSKWSWKKENRGDTFPDNTQGAWVKQSKIVMSMSGSGSLGHVLGISCLSHAEQEDVAFDIRNLRLEAVSDEVAAKSTRKVCGKVRARIVPVNPLLSAVHAEKGEMTFYWAGSSICGRTNCTVVVRLDERKGTASCQLDSAGYAKVALGKMKCGAHKISVEVRDPSGKVLASDSYAITAIVPIAESAVGRRLNNFVTELVNRPLEDGTVSFTRARAGWVWISFGAVDPAEEGGNVRAYLDDWGQPVVYRRDGERYLETQRWVSAGEHRLRIVGAPAGRTLRIHAVKTIWGSAPSDLRALPLGTWWSFTYRLPFMQRFSLISTFNTMSRVNQYLDGRDDTGAGFYYERGIRLMGGDKFTPDDPDHQTLEDSLRHLKSGSWRLGRTVNVDENLLSPAHDVAVNFSEAVWQLFAEEPSRRINVWYADTSTGKYHREPEINVSEIAAIVNTGNGTGLLMPELYAPVKAGRESLTPYLDGYANFVQAAEHMVPAATGATVLYGAGYIDLFDWTNYVEPATDIKAHYSEMVRVFATDPRFAGCAGIGFGGGMCCEEEFRRWGAKVLRHYALEGATDDLAKEYGFVWTPGFVKNSDFADGLENWTVRAAETNGVRAEAIKGYGRQYQNRIGVEAGVGDSVALFTASASGVNELAQPITGLEPGRYYSLHFGLANKDTLKAFPGKAPPVSPAFFSARLQGAEEVEELRYVHHRRGHAAKGEAKNKASLRSFRYVFKATAPTAELVFCDQAHDGTRNRVGTELALNYIILRPYYVENAREIADVVQALGWKGPGPMRPEPPAAK